MTGTPPNGPRSGGGGPTPPPRAAVRWEVSPGTGVSCVLTALVVRTRAPAFWNVNDWSCLRRCMNIHPEIHPSSPKVSPRHRETCVSCAARAGLWTGRDGWHCLGAPEPGGWAQKPAVRRQVPPSQADREVVTFLPSLGSGDQGQDVMARAPGRGRAGPRVPSGHLMPRRRGPVTHSRPPFPGHRARSARRPRQAVVA